MWDNLIRFNFPADQDHEDFFHTNSLVSSQGQKEIEKHKKENSKTVEGLIPLQNHFVF